MSILSAYLNILDSNGADQQNWDSLHYRDPSGTLNKYELAISSVLNIIEDYDNDKHFPTYGFGAHVPATGPINHVFNINADNTQCTRVDGTVNIKYRYPCFGRKS